MNSRGLLLIFFAILTAVSVAADQSSDEYLPPVILHAPRPLTPIETAGTGLAPVVNVRLTVSARGSVSGLEITAIEPGSEYDALFDAEVRRTVGAWHFAPALQGDLPVAAEFEWVLEFRPAEADSRSPVDAMPRRSSLIRDEDPQHARLAKIFTLPVERQRAHLMALSKMAEKSIDPARRQSLKEGGVTVVTDHPDPGAAQAILNTVHAATGMTLEIFADGIPLQRPRLPLLVYVFRSKTQYGEFIRSVEGILETAGFFCPPGLIAFHAEQPTRQHLMTVMVHETVHAAMYRWVVRPGHVLPRWISEGLADYLGNSPVKKGRIQPGKNSGTQVYRAQAYLWRGKSIAQMDLQTIKRKIRKGEGLAVENIVSADRETFYGENMGLYYAQSWVLIHFLRHGKDEWSARAFPEFLLYVGEGYRADVALQTAYGLDAPSLEAPYREYVRRF
ncbi:MAG: hypothetical protein DRJ65_06455 [Acidobacteria bacterium]|nr:MAG: hypothetical protein DRJ65_06455 [Acidobacteriota bacterium]